MATRFGSRPGPAPAPHRRTPSTNAATTAVMAPATRVLRAESRGSADVATDGVRASPNSVAVRNRSAGLFARAVVMAASIPDGIVSRSRRTDGTGSVNRLAITTWAFGPVYGGSPTSISYSTHARL